MTVFLIYCQLFFFSFSADHRRLHSFPTRRSSDLASRTISSCWAPGPWRGSISGWSPQPSNWWMQDPRPRRSEEHTSELQSHSDLVCRLLLEKKKNEWKTPRQ